MKYKVEPKSTAHLHAAKKKKIIKVMVFLKGPTKALPQEDEFLDAACAKQ